MLAPQHIKLPSVGAKGVRLSRFALALSMHFRITLLAGLALFGNGCDGSRIGSNPESSGREIQVRVDGSQKFQRIDGFGVNANSASWNSGELQPAIDLLIDEGGATLWRVVVEMADWELVNDDDDPESFNLDYYGRVFGSPKFESLWSLLGHLNNRGIDNNLVLNIMGRGPAWMGGADLPEHMEAEWVETVAALAQYARQNRGLRFGIFAPNNEPDWDGIEGIRMSPSQYARTLGMLSLKLDRIGLGNLRLMGPDTARIDAGVDEYMPALMANRELMAKIDHFGLHNYQGNAGGAEAALQSSSYPDRNFWVTELSNIQDALPLLSQGVAAIMVWDAFDSVYDHAIVAGRGTNPPNDVGNGPPLLAYEAATGTYSPRKPFFQFAQLFRLVPPGSIRIGTEENGQTSVWAFLHADSGRVTLVGHNSSQLATSYFFTLNDLPDVETLELHQTNEEMNFRLASRIEAKQGTFQVNVPASTVFTLSAAPPPELVLGTPQSNGAGALPGAPTP